MHLHYLPSLDDILGSLPVVEQAELITLADAMPPLADDAGDTSWGAS